MGTYTTTRCGNCGIAWESMSYGRHSLFGPDKVKCSHCLQINNTKQRLWRDMNIFEKGYVLIGQIINGFLFGGLGTIFGLSVLSGYINDFESFSLWQLWGLIPLGFGLFQFYNLFTLKSQMRKTETLYDNNGGFLWSNEQYY